MALESGIKSLKTVVAIYEADIDSAEKTLSIAVDVQPYDPVKIGLRSALVKVLGNEINSKVRSYVDKERFLKTLINFGNDTQRIVTNWKLDPNDSTKLLVKLLSPLDFNLDVGNRVFINREVADTVVDTIKLELLPQSDTSMWLRPKNTDLTSFSVDFDIIGPKNRKVSNQTLSSIGINLTGSEDQYGGYTFENQLLRKWYTDDYKSVELNIDYTNYANFVTYSSAKLRLDAFKQKITKIRELENKSRFYTTGTTGSIFGFQQTTIETPTIYYTDTTLASPVLIDESGSAEVTTGSTLSIYAVDALPSAAVYMVEGAKQQLLK